MNSCDVVVCRDFLIRGVSVVFFVVDLDSRGELLLNWGKCRHETLTLDVLSPHELKKTPTYARLNLTLSPCMPPS